MIDLERYRKLKAQADQAQTTADKAAGALDALMRQLHEDYGVATIPEAERLLQKLNRQAAATEQEYNDALAEFENNWKAFSLAEAD